MLRGGFVQEFDGRVAVVTGGASGIGLALAGRLSAEGMRVFLVDVNEARLRDAAVAVPGSAWAAVDIGDADAVQAAADRCRDELGLASLLCANAGVPGPTGRRLWEVPAAAWAETFRVNVFGTANTLRAFVPQLIEAGDGHVVVTASMAGVSRANLLPAYFSSKHAVVSMAETLDAQLDQLGLPIGVSVLLPSRVATNFGELHDAEFDETQVLTESPRAITADEVADRVIAAIRYDQLYVFTHPESRARVARWWDDISAAFTRLD
jgi:NAD(P)-dependent dehydrogenase (short-subunit alcohol dehydrogenase family)